MLLLLAAEGQLVDPVERIAQHVAVLELVAHLAEDLADLVLDGAGVGRGLLEAAQIGHQVGVHELDQVRADAGPVEVGLAVGQLRRGPGGPAVVFGEDEVVGLADQLRLDRALVLEIVEVFEEQHPGRLLDVIELGVAAGLLEHDVVEIFERLLEHAAPEMSHPNSPDGRARSSGAALESRLRAFCGARRPYRTLAMVTSVPVVTRPPWRRDPDRAEPCLSTWRPSIWLGTAAVGRRASSLKLWRRSLKREASVWWGRTLGGMFRGWMHEVEFLRIGKQEDVSNASSSRLSGR